MAHFYAVNMLRHLHVPGHTLSPEDVARRSLTSRSSPCPGVETYDHELSTYYVLKTLSTYYVLVTFYWRLYAMN